MMEYLLEARGICKSYGDLVANDNINLAVSAGVIHALIAKTAPAKAPWSTYYMARFPPMPEVFLARPGSKN